MADHPLPYSRPTDPGKRHSHALTDGPDRAAARAMLKAVGFTDDDLAQPIVGVATTWIETMPCNLNQRRLAVAVKEGVRAAGGTPMEFNTIAVSDGVAMGTEGMKASLVSREVVADSIELVARGNAFDGLVCLSGCDKTNPGVAKGLTSRTGLVLTADLVGLSSKGGRYGGRSVGAQPYPAWAASSARTVSATRRYWTRICEYCR